MQPVYFVASATFAGLLTAPVWRLTASPVVLGATCFALLLVFLFKRSVFLPFFCCLFFLLFVNLSYWQASSPAAGVVAIDSLAGKLSVTGVVGAAVPLTEGRCRADVDIESVLDKGRTVPGVRGLRVRLYVEDAERCFLPGDVIRFKTRLRQPRLFKIPGEFDWPRYLAGQGIDLSGWVAAADLVEVSGVRGRRVARPVAQWRSLLAERIERTLPPPRAELVRALILGQGRLLSADIRRTLSSGGVSHLFAISGLHLGLIAVFGYRICFAIVLRLHGLIEQVPPQRLLPLLMLPVLLFYLILTGDAVSTRRAFALALLGSVFLLWRYHVNPLVLLASLATLSLAVNPLLLWQAGWQLSFAGAAGILLWQPWWRPGRLAGVPGWLRYPFQMLVVTAAATLATLPLVIMNFHIVATAGLVTNLVCVPLVTLVALPLGLAGLVLFVVQPDLADLCFRGCGMVLEFLVRFVDRVIMLDGLGGQFLFLNHWQHAAIAFAVVLFLLWPHRVRNLRFGVFAAATPVVVALLWLLPSSPRADLSLTLFSVGQGESMLLRNGRGQTLLIDGGGLYGDRFDVGERLLAPALGAMKVRHLDAVLLTHDHPDHRKGLIFLLDHFSVGAFYGSRRPEELSGSLKQALQRNGIPCETIKPGWNRLDFWGEGTLKAFAAAGPQLGENDSSVVLYLDTPDNAGILLTGDLEADGVERLLKAGIPGPVKLLKLPHHGSRYSSIDRLVELLDPDLCLVSAGYRNRYHLPARSVIRDLASKGISLYRTDTDGTVQALFDSGTWTVE